MKASWEDASSILNKYVSEQTKLSGVLSYLSRKPGTGPASRVVGRIELREDNGIWIVVISDNEVDSISFPVAFAEFEFGDSREAPPELRESSARKFNSVLSVINPPSRMVLHLFELSESLTQ